MEATERLVRTWMATGRDEEIRQTVAVISSGETSLASVVKALGEYLTSDEDVLRTKGVDFLSQIISQCPTDKINRQATRVLVSFYVGKLEDRETILPALKGILTLTTLPTFTSSDAVEIIRALFEHADMKSLLQSGRYNVFQIIDSLLARHRQALQDINDEFLAGYISLVDGEKDPRNLMLVFSMDRVICIEFDISRHVDELFNVIYCYFPITFKTPEDDPYGITADDLRLALRRCLAASSSFGRLGVPLFLEKLLAGSPSTKRDILETIGLCIPVYGSDAAKHFATKLWNSLKLEVFQPINAEAEAEALKTTQILIKTIYDDSVPSGSDTDDLQGLVKEICEECLELMNEPEKSQAVPAGKVAAALIGTNPKVTRLVLSNAIPHILKLFRNPDEISHRPQILGLLCIIISAIEAKLPSFLGDEELLHQLLSYKDEVLVTFIAGINVKDDREAALEGIKKLVKMDSVLTEEELVYVVHSINSILPSDNEDIEETSGNALDVLVEVAEKNSKIIEESTLPLLFSSLPDHPPARSAHDERAKHWRTLRWLARLCTSVTLFETLVVRLSTKLDLIGVPKSGISDPDDLELRAAYMHTILKTLVDVLEVKIALKHTDVPKYIDRLVPRLFNLFFYLALSDGGISESITDPRLVKVASQIVTLVVQTLPKERQIKFVKDLQDAYFSGDLTRIAVGQQTLPTFVVFSPFASNAPIAQKNLVAFLEAAIIGFQKDVTLPDHDLSSFLKDVQLWALNNAENDLEREAAYHIISSLVNKNVEKVTPFLSDQENHFWKEEIFNISQSVERRRIAIETWLWILKGLVMRNFEIQSFVGHLFELLDDEHVGWDAARAIGKIGSGGNNILTKRNHAVIRILYAQKYFAFVFPLILKEVKGSSQRRQSAGLVALTSLITSLPQSIYVKEMQTLMPLLIRGLDLPDVSIRTSIFDTLQAVVVDGGKEATEEHASTLVTSALKNALSREKNSVPLRIAALKYLAVIPSIVRYDILHPQRATVIRELEKALDDPKRVVRKEAVDARTTWFLYNG